MIYLNVKDSLIRELSKSFDKKINFDKRIKVLSDLLLFNPKEDLSVWKQKKGDSPEYFTVYFDDEYICGFSEKQSLNEAVLAFWKGFKEAYKNNKIRLNQKVVLETNTVTKKVKTPTNSVERMGKEIAERLTK